MKYCCEYFGEFPGVEFYDEIIVRLIPGQDITNIQDFFQNRPQTVIIHIIDSADFNENITIERLAQLLPPSAYNYKVKLTNPNIEVTQTLVQQCQQYEIPYFFDVLVDDWDVLQYLITLKPTDMYIVNCLGFEIGLVGTMLHNHNIKVRVFPNIAQAAVRDVDSTTKFWIRPEDTDVYAPYVDIFEFFLPKDNNVLKQLYYTVYAQEQLWTGPMEILIAGLEEGIYGGAIFKEFATKRTMCGKVCAKGDKCQFCQQIKTISELLYKEGWSLEYPRAEKTNTAWDRLTEEQKQELRQMVIDKFKNL